MKENDFNEIYKRNYRRSFLFVKSYVHDDMAAEDIVAESLVKYWRAISPLGGAFQFVLIHPHCFLFNYPSIQMVIIRPYHKLIELRLG